MNEAAGTMHYIVLWVFAAYGVYRFAKDIFLNTSTAEMITVRTAKTIKINNYYLYIEI